MTAHTPRPIYTLTIRPEPQIDGIRALRAAIKVLGRRFGLRVVAIHEQRDADERDAA